MRVWVNGRELHTEEGITLMELLKQLGVEPKSVGFAVSVNEEIIPKSKYSEHVLKENDRIEIVNIVGGG